MIKEYSLAGVIAAWFLIKKWFDDISKILEPVCKEVEKMAVDGKIDKADRKAIAMKTIAELEACGKIKLSFLSRSILSKIVDHIAGKLPDFTITKAVNGILEETT